MRKWKPSKKSVAEFKNQMNKIDTFCAENGITQSASSDSYYFALNGIEYRVSNHSVEASNRGAYNAFGEQVREKYHNDTRSPEMVYIHASKTRIIEIYNNLKDGKILDGRGNIK